MKKSRLDTIKQHGIAFDTETHKIQPGLLAPPLVLGSCAVWDPSVGVRGDLLDKPGALDLFVSALHNPDAILVGANIAFDMLVMAHYAAGKGSDILPFIFNAYEQERVYDVLIAEQLHAIANGLLGKDPRTGKPIRDPITGKPAGYSLATTTQFVLGRTNAKANDKFRGSYALFDGLPLDQLPPEAQVYPVDDAVNTLQVALGQTGFIDIPGDHLWAATSSGETRCHLCKIDLYSEAKPCVPRKTRHRNLHDLAAQTYTAFCMHLGAAWGFQVDQKAVDSVEERVTAGRPAKATSFLSSGILKLVRKNGETKPGRDMRVIKRLVAQAYGCSDACIACKGTGTVPHVDSKTVNCGKRCQLATGYCILCNSTGARPNKLSNCKHCDGTGLDISSTSVPRTDGSTCKPCKGTGTVEGDDCEQCDGAGVMQGIGTGRDVLQESANEELMLFAHYLEDSKFTETYIPWLRTARINIGTDLTPIWKDIPLNLRPNVLKETGRTSYSGVVQLLPRKGGIRECIKAREGYVFCSVDYDSGELITHAQSCINLVKHSALAQALNNGIKVHNALAATILGLSYEEYQKRFKAHDKQATLVRQAAKPANFGFPGRMGAAKLVIQQRVQGPDTECANGPSLLHFNAPDGTAYEAHGYKGLRFCILMDGATSCGDKKVTEWKGRPLPPVCLKCIECAERLRVKFLTQWPENNDYFELVKTAENEGQPITAEQAALFGQMALAPGEVVQHVSNRIRGGTYGAESIGNAIANGWFQGLLADITKSALRRACREMYIPTHLADGARSPLYGSRFILFAHDELIAELLQSKQHEAAHRLRDIMVEEMQHYCPHLKQAAKAPPALMKRWYKGAEPVYDDGLLVPWVPS